MRSAGLLSHLIDRKGRFGPESAARTLALLHKLDGTRFRDSTDLIHLHEAVLFLRAYPQSPEVVRLADEILFSFGEMLPKDRAAFEDPDISGIAGTAVSTSFSYEFVRSLRRRHPRNISIDWENFEHSERLAIALEKLIPASRDDWAVEAHPDYRAWFEKGHGSLQWLLDNLTSDVYNLLEIPVKWEPGDASRSHLRISVKDVFYHDGPLLKREPGMIAKAFSAPPLGRRTLAPAAARRIAGTIVDASAIRYRELYGFLYPDLSRLEHASFGRGVDVFLFGPAKPLPVRHYLCGMFFKNGVPMGYIEALTRDGNMEVGFNLYYTFRYGETAWLYAALLKLLRERERGVKSFSVDPYQIGHENEEAIESGAFWFYRKLGFAPESADVSRLLGKEERTMETQSEYRTPAATLRKLAVSRLLYSVTANMAHTSSR